MKKALRIIEGVFAVLGIILSMEFGVGFWVLNKTNNLEAIDAITSKAAEEMTK